MKREGISTLFIHGFPWALSFLLDHLRLFECVLVMWVLKVFLKRCQCGGNLCNDPCGDVYKDVCLLKKFSFCF